MQLIKSLTAAWLLVLLADRTTGQASYYVYKPVYYPVAPSDQFYNEYVVPRPPSHSSRTNYYSTERGGVPIKFPDDDSTSRESYFSYQENESSPNDGRRTPQHPSVDKIVTNDKRYETVDEQEDESYLDDEMMEKMQILDRVFSDDSTEKEVDANSIEGQVLAGTNIPEETKRVVRQVKRQRPGFFWTLAKVTFQTINDTTSAIKQISQIISNNILPDSATSRSSLMASTATTELPPTATDSSGNDTTPATTTTTTKAPFVLTRSLLQSLIRRNVLGLVKLFNLEWREALNQSELNTREFQKELGNQIGSYLQDNPDVF